MRLNIWSVCKYGSSKTKITDLVLHSEILLLFATSAEIIHQFTLTQRNRGELEELGGERIQEWRN